VFSLYQWIVTIYHIDLHIYAGIVSRLNVIVSLVHQSKEINVYVSSSMTAWSQYSQLIGNYFKDKNRTRTIVIKLFNIIVCVCVSLSLSTHISPFSRHWRFDVTPNNFYLTMNFYYICLCEFIFHSKLIIIIWKFYFHQRDVVYLIIIKNAIRRLSYWKYDNKHLTLIGYHWVWCWWFEVGYTIWRISDSAYNRPYVLQIGSHL